MSSPKTDSRIRSILLADGSDEAVACAAVLMRNDVAVDALVVGPNVPRHAVEAIAGQFPVAPTVVVSSRPDQDSFILDLLDKGRIDFLFSCLYEYRIRPSLLGAAKKGAMNIHTAVLPHNRGIHTSYWGIVDGTPLGATMHWMDESLDTGDIIGQAVFEDDGLMSAAEVRQRQLQLCVHLFETYLPLIVRGEAPRRPQPPGGSYHFKRDIEAATSFEAEDTVTMGQLLRLARATNYGTHGFYVRVGDRKFKVQASVSEVTP